VTCLRNSYSDEKWAERLGPQKFLPAETVYSIIDQIEEMDFRGTVNFSHYNEPTLDKRLGEFGAYAMKKNRFRYVMTHSNADFLNEETAARINGNFTDITIALYDDDSQNNRNRIQGLLPDTRIFFTGGGHHVTHFSPRIELGELINRYRGQPCWRWVQRRMIIGYTGDMILCCEDVGLLPYLGSIFDTSIHDLWYSDLHTEIINKLSVPGGRENYEFCTICPHPNETNDDY
jgi:hypothetical protein